MVMGNDGNEYSEYLEYPKGDPREPMTMEDLENKFNSLAGDKFKEKDLNDLKELIFNCDNLSTRDFMTQLAIP